ncbi:MAG: phosphoribosylformylglycinamidine cyclo-ligase [Phycisphaeraceae bacterium]|nr:phosphoribosylformylglycinamidine cyclo-ligase [Phycisphaeraceae bacterium]
MAEQLSYEKSGVNIATADATKREMAKSLETTDARVLNRLGAFASLFDGRFPGYEHPVLVLKTEEPGSKQKLALSHGRVESIAQDMIHHLINDIAVMGAKPLSVQDAIICGKLEKEVVKRLVDAMAKACREHGCTLTGGETSEQPGVLEAGGYVLVSSVVGVVEKSRIIDGSAIRQGDVVLAVASNGLHTNGYSLVRALMERRPEILAEKIDGQSFMDAILQPHRCYLKPLVELFDLPKPRLHGLAHITGGGIEGNLNRVLPAGLDAAIDLDKIRVLPLFSLIRRFGAVPDADMLRTFNLGVGLTAVVDPADVETVCGVFRRHGQEAYAIGCIENGNQQVRYRGQMRWV